MNEEAPPGLVLRIVISIIVFFGLLIFSIIYVAFFASSFSLFQQIAVILAALLVAITILGVMWVMWAFNLEENVHEIL